MAENTNANTGTEQNAQNQQQTQEQQNTQQNAGANVDYSRVQQMIDERTARAENAVLKSFFDQQGVSEEEAKKLIADFKATKAQEAAAKETALSDAQKEVATLKAQIMQGKIDASIAKAAAELGVDAKTIPYITKLANLDGIANDKGEIDDAKVTEALKKVIDDIPAFKGTAFTNIGAGADNGKSGDNAQGDKAVTPQKRWNRFNR